MSKYPTAMYMLAGLAIVCITGFGAYCVSMGHNSVVIASVMTVVGSIVAGLGGFVIGTRRQAG